MLITVTTHNSVYEFDMEKQRTRRVRGANPPRSMMVPDGEWQAYEWFTPPIVGDVMFIHYGPHIYDSVRTSLIERVEECDVVEWNSPSAPPEEVVVNGTTYRLVEVNTKVIPNEYSYEAINEVPN